MATKTQICNLALSLIGETGIQLSDVDTDGTVAANQCLLHYDTTLNELVRMHTWNCAKFRTQLTTASYSGHEWDFYSAVPTGCLRPIALQDASSSSYYKLFIDWVVESGNILTNYEDPFLLYIKAPAEADMDPLFMQAFYTLLAVKLVIPILGRNASDTRVQLLNEFQLVLAEARRVNGFESDETKLADSEWINATLNGNSVWSDWAAFSGSEGSWGTFSW